MSLMMTPAASCKPFARAPARAGARRSVALCRAQAVEPARFVLPGAKALTAAAAAALLAASPAFADPPKLPGYGPQDALGQRQAMAESTSNDKSFQTAREDATLDNAFGDSSRPRDRSRQSQPFVPGSDKSDRVDQFKETLKQTGPVGGPDQLT